MRPDPNRSRAVLVGVSEFDDATLDDLPTVADGVGRLRDLLVDPTVWGLPPDHCTVVLNPRSGDDLLDPIADGCAAADDAFVLYYAGHGILDPRPFELYLATVATRLAPIRRSLRFDDVRRVLEPRRTLSKVVILDCCYSGLAIGGTMGDGVKVSDQLLVSRSYIMTATSATRLALAPPDEPFPAFTGELIRVLGEGIAGGPDDLTMASIYGQVLSGLAARRRPTPQASADNDGHTIVLARNRAVRPSPRPPAPRPADLPPDRAGVLELTPAATVAYLTDLAEADRRTVLDAIGAHREPQQVGAVAHALERAGRGVQAATVVAAVARRPAGDVLATLDSLDVFGLREAGDDLLRAVGRGDDVLVCALGPRLPEPRRVVLVEAAVRRAVGDPAAVIRLVGLLWATECRSAVERVLYELARTMGPEDAAALADALGDAGYDEAAFAPYRVAEAVIAARPPRAAVGVAVSMTRAGHDGWAHRLLTRVVERPTDAPAAREVLDALWTAGLPGAAGRALGHLAERLDDEEVRRLSLLLRADGRTDEALDLLKRATSTRAVGSLEGYFGFLLDQGLVIDARDLLTHAGTVLDGADLAAVATRVDATLPAASFASDLIRAAAGRTPQCCRDLLLRLACGSAEPHRLAAVAVREIVAVGAAHGLSVAVLVIRAGWRTVAGELVRAVAERFGSPDAVVEFGHDAPAGDLGAILRADDGATDALVAMLVPGLPPAHAGAVLDTLLRLVPSTVGRLVREIALRGPDDLLVRFAEQVAAFGSVRDIGEVLERGRALASEDVERRVLAVLGWDPRPAPVAVDPLDPRRFHVAAWLAHTGRCPPSVRELAPYRAPVTAVNLAVSWIVGSGRPGGRSRWPRWKEPEYSALQGLEADDEALFVWYFFGSSKLVATAREVRLQPSAGRAERVLSYSMLAATRFEADGRSSFTVWHAGQPVTEFLDFSSTEGGGSAVEPVVALFNDLAALVRSVLDEGVSDPGPTRR